MEQYTLSPDVYLRINAIKRRKYSKRLKTRPAMGGFTIMDVANKVGVLSSTIRYWEKEYDISPERNKKGDRRYKSSDIEKYQKIKDLSEYLTGNGIRAVLSGKIEINL